MAQATGPDDDCENGSGDEDESDPVFLNDLLDGQDTEETADMGDADEEIRVSFDGSGKLVPMGNQLADSQKRDNELNHVCVWDFISRVDRSRWSLPATRRRHPRQKKYLVTNKTTSMIISNDMVPAAQVDEASIRRNYWLAISTVCSAQSQEETLGIKWEEGEKKQLPVLLAFAKYPAHVAAGLRNKMNSHCVRIIKNQGVHQEKVEPQWSNT
ncbi:hypothetical protein B0H14DRAFT_2650017 [Mycena olivaceomarginata]|nr:hypothetical protein B0H14DRAFT_2650017 [Mycena olivaceomarginata]